MSRDSSATYLHMHSARHADLLESFTHPHSSSLTPEDIYIPPHLQPINPEDEDDVVPDQHAAFGITRATQTKRETQWRDLGLEELMRRGPGEVGGVGGGGNAGGGGQPGAGANAQGGVGGAGAGAGGTAGTAGTTTGAMGMVRRDEPVVLALRRRPGVARGSGRRGLIRVHGMAGGGGGNSGNGLPR